MYTIYQAAGNWAFKIGNFKEIEEAQDYVLDLIQKDIEDLKKDNPDVNEEELQELAASYYSIEKEIK